MNKYLIAALLLTSACNRPVADGAFIGNWYVLGFENGFEHWEIDEKNNVYIYDKLKDSLRFYHLETRFYEPFFTDFPNFYIISDNKKDSIVFDWIEAPNYPPVIPEDEIRIYHSFVMVRSDELSIKDMTKTEIYNYFINSTFKYEYHGTDFIIYLSDEKLDHLKYRANIKANGCLELSTTEAYWSLDTLSNSIVFEHSLFSLYNQTLLVNDIKDDTITVDIDEFYWFRRNIKLSKITNLENKFYSPEKFERHRFGNNDFECEF